MVFLIKRLVLFFNKIIKPVFLNVGGGPNFCELGWKNLEEQKSFFNCQSFKLSGDCKFPLNNGSIKIVYTSHCLEHLDDRTVLNVINESNRVLSADGHLIIKLPDYDEIISSWRRKQQDIFYDKIWCFDSIVPTWEVKGIKDSIDYRAAMLFCGFWNDDFGNPFSGVTSSKGLAYHGPPVVSESLIRELLDKAIASKISKTLSEIVQKNEKSYYFNHRNAWSRKELESLLAVNGFKVVSFEDQKIISKFCLVPGIKEMRKLSMYCWAMKKG